MNTYYFLLSILLSTVSLTDCCSSRKIPKSRPPPMVAVTPTTSNPNQRRLPYLTDSAVPSLRPKATSTSHSNLTNEAQNLNPLLEEKLSSTTHITSNKTQTIANEANINNFNTSNALPPMGWPTKGQPIQKNLDNKVTTNPSTTKPHQGKIDAAENKDDNNKTDHQQTQRQPEQRHYAHQCSRDFEESFCLHGGKCYFYNIGNGTLTYCVCPKDYFGERCESKSLDGSYHADLLKSSKRIRIETASICFGAFVAFFLVILVLYSFYYYTKSSFGQRN